MPRRVFRRYKSRLWFRRSAFLSGSILAWIMASLLLSRLLQDRVTGSLSEPYPSSESSQLSPDLRRWLGFDRRSEVSPSVVSPTSAPTPNPSPNFSPSPIELDPDTIHHQAQPFTVEVWIETATSFAPAAGVLISASGLVLTNHHVINGTTFHFVRLADGKDYQGQIIASDPALDLALIQLEGASNLPVATLAIDSTHVGVGDTVYAIGSPAESHWKMTTAQVIAVQSSCGLAALACIRTPQGFLQPGNSGGPLLDQFGQVVGINRAIQQQTGEGVSIPVETVKQFIVQATDDRR